MQSARDRERACGFCDGTGLWPDPEVDVAGSDPCPLCDGTGFGPRPSDHATADVAEVEAPTLARLMVLLPRLTTTERQRLYEELHARYDCRIYRS